MKVFLCTFIVFSTLISATMKNTSPMLLKYLIREPKVKSAHPSLLILLHGVGGNQADLFSFANQLPDKYLVISAQAPILLGENRFAWYQVDFSTGKPVFNFEQEEKSRKIIIDFIEALKEKYGVDSHEIYLCGFSQGAIMSYSVALTRPDLVKGIAIMSGRLLEEIKPQIVPKEKLSHLKIYISHGSSDNTLPIQYAISANAFLQTVGCTPIFNQYNAGHSINNEMLNDLLNWLK
ncbi:alpha/beta hydrolase [Emticicia sp. SJ17W-69]|uniref:alpha/beta hydrolase n=1 Tax=Emticicia sp. SJ17W-69 TaxID=3421657 RepID=UPI003EBF766C